VDWKEEQTVAEPNGEQAQQEARQQRDIELLIGVRRNEVRALREFVRLFQPILLDQARRLDVSPSERTTVVTGFLDDILVKLSRLQAPRSLTSFVVTSFRNCVADMHREIAIQERHARAQEEMIGTECVISAGCSEFMLRAAQGPDIDDEPAMSPSAALVRILFDGCSFEDRQLLVWSAHRVPLRDCAEWLDISYDSAKQRLSRLRARLIRGSIACLSDLSAPDRANMVRLLHRAGVKIDAEQTEGSAA
jgi:DNA-directed RNA polymerase specialized sigma24 family protein